MKNKNSHCESAYSSVSARIIDQLEKEGMKKEQIGRAMGLSRSFISLVKNQRRSLTMDRLKRLEKSLNRPLPLLLLQAMKEKSVTKELMPQYKQMRRILKKGAEDRKLSWKL